MLMKPTEQTAIDVEASKATHDNGESLDFAVMCQTFVITSMLRCKTKPC